MRHQKKWSRIAVFAFAFCLAAFAASTLAEGAESGVELTPVFAATSFSGKTFLGPQAVCVDSERGDVYVADTGNGRIVVFNSDGHPLTSFKHRKAGGGAGEPIGVAVDKTGRVFVTDTSSHVIHVYDLRGRQIDKIEPEAKDADALFGRITVDARGNLYAAVRNKGRVYVYDEKGALKLKIPFAGDEDLPKMISDVAVDTRGRVLAVSSLGMAVHEYDAKGSSLLQFGKHSEGPGSVAFPTSIDVDSRNRIWLTDSFAGCIKMYTSAGEFLTSIGGLNLPVDLAIWPKENRLFVLEKNARRLSSYTIRPGRSQQ